MELRNKGASFGFKDPDHGANKLVVLGTVLNETIPRRSVLRLCALESRRSGHFPAPM